MTEEEIKTLNLSGVSTGDGFFEFTAKEKCGKRTNSMLLDMINLKTYLQQEFYKNNVPKYYKYFEDWLSKLTPVQIDYFIAYSKNQKTPFYTYNDIKI